MLILKEGKLDKHSNMYSEELLSKMRRWLEWCHHVLINYTIEFLLWFIDSTGFVSHTCIVKRKIMQCQSCNEVNQFTRITVI